MEERLKLLNTPRSHDNSTHVHRSIFGEPGSGRGLNIFDATPALHRPPFLTTKPRQLDGRKESFYSFYDVEISQKKVSKAQKLYRDTGA
jgi:hypothetical protein